MNNKRGEVGALSTNMFMVAFFCLVCLPRNSFAYIDPGSGSLILQGIVAGIAMGLYTIKLYWYKLKNLFKHGDKPVEKNVEDAED